MTGCCLLVHSSHKPWDNWGAFFEASCPTTFHSGFVLTPGWYVGAEDVVDDGEPFEGKMGRLAAKLGEQFAESERLTVAIQKNLKRLDY